MLLKNLLEHDNFNLSDEDLKRLISSIEIDSRKVQENSIFFALKGRLANGVQFIDLAIKRGATVIVCDQSEDLDINPKALLIKVENPHQLLVLMLQKFYPNLPNNIIAVTGTNGKTSVAEFCRQIFENMGKSSATIGTLGVNCANLDIKDKIVNSTLTTPDIVTLYRNLSILKEFNVDHVIIEASSIGIEQGRLDGINFKAAAFTNFTQDHLDYHNSMSEYLGAKMILFNKMLKTSSIALINSDINRFPDIKKSCLERNLNFYSYGYNESDFHILSSVENDDNKDVSLRAFGKEINFRITLLENFQEVNITCALSLVGTLLNLDEHGIEKLAKEELIKLNPVNGRMEKVATLKNNAKIYIDFAHTPDALENLLKIAKKHSKGRVIIVFGCGGDRDDKKRPLMGKIAEELADLAVITDDNPRTEDASKIREEIIGGISNKDKIIEIGNRRQAIEESIQMLKSNDILVIAGKGHEQYQIVGDKHLPFDEKQIINNCLN